MTNLIVPEADERDMKFGNFVSEHVSNKAVGEPGVEVLYCRTIPVGLVNAYCTVSELFSKHKYQKHIEVTTQLIYIHEEA